jgi:hypothetical protein
VELLGGPVVVLDGPDCAVLGPQLVEAIRLAYTVRSGTAPHALLDFSDQVSRIGRFRVSAEAGAGRETGRLRAGLSSPSSDQPVWLTADEAARIAGVSVQYMRRCLRRGDLKGTQGHRSAWRVDAVGLAAWMISRRREDQHKAA